MLGLVVGSPEAGLGPVHIHPVRHTDFSLKALVGFFIPQGMLNLVLISRPGCLSRLAGSALRTCVPHGLHAHKVFNPAGDGRYRTVLVNCAAFSTRPAFCPAGDAACNLQTLRGTCLRTHKVFNPAGDGAETVLVNCAATRPSGFLSRRGRRIQPASC